jgi:CHAT domain-containing protein
VRSKTNKTFIKRLRTKKNPKNKNQINKEIHEKLYQKGITLIQKDNEQNKI